MLALWLIKIARINLIEPYTLEHLKKMIHSVNDDYRKFKYKAFLVDLKAMHRSQKITIKVPFLIDCIDLLTAKKVIENISNRLNAKEFLSDINTDNDIHELKEVGLLTDDFKTKLEEVKLLMGYDSFSQKVEKLKKSVEGSPYFLDVDILSGTSQIKKVLKLPISTSANYPGIQIGIDDDIFNK
ncbi:hypothetical protein SAMN05428975_3450 [Mucilaginibacter sp. OK268]|nr:hypothetical protein SAMN05428975_3450 [Mucilaginibacter sp. OK268]